MLALLLSFLGVGVAGAAAGGGGGGSDSTDNQAVSIQPQRDREVIAPPVDRDDHMDHGDDEPMDQDHAADDRDDHMDHGDDEPMDQDHAADDRDDHMDHGDDMGHTAIPLPETVEEIAAFVAAVKASPEAHSHDMGSSKAGEHMAAMDLVPRDEASHIAIANGDWDDPSNWHNGEVPGEGAKVLIPQGVHMLYDHVGEDSVFTVRVDGHLDFATDTNSQLIVDTIVITPTGKLTIGTEDDPVRPDVNVDIIFADNGPIDTNWDPMLLSRGMVAHGETSIHGTVKDSHDKVVDDPMAGDTWIDFGSTPEGWAVGDTIVIAGTTYDGYYNRIAEGGYEPSQDEVRVITQIDDGMVFFEEPLVFDHDTPRADLKTSVANYTRNVSFETENAETAEVYERGHVMFMHNDDVDVRYAEFHELGRTDKSETALNVGEFDEIAFDSNVKGRYAFHFHRAGTGDLDDPAMAVGNAVYGSPGWGYVHHDSNAILENNASFDTFGAGYVAESGNETGAWNDNIAIFAQGQDWKGVKSGNDIANFDLGQSGDGFWFQGRMVESTDNVAASVNHGFVYFHRGHIGETGNIIYEAGDTEYGALFYDKVNMLPDLHPILGFSGNETFASRTGLDILKANPNQTHDVHSVLEDFTAWNIDTGVSMAYTSHYTLKGFDLVGREETLLSDEARVGIQFGSNTSDVAFVDTTVDGFDIGASLYKSFVNAKYTPDQHDYIFVNPTFTDVDEEFEYFDSKLDTVLSSDEVPAFTPDLELDGPLYFSDSGDRKLYLNGTKKDGLGEVDFPAGTDEVRLAFHQVVNEMVDEGYYTTSDGQNYFMLDVYFSDRLTGDIYFEKHPVMLDAETVTPGTSFYKNSEFNGIQDLGVEGDPTIDSAQLWATLTDGQVELSEQAIEENLNDIEIDEFAA